MLQRQINRRQFTPKGACKSCDPLSLSSSLCKAPKIWELLQDSVIVIIKHYGLHSFSPIKPKPER